MIGQKARMYGIVTSSLIIAILAVSMMVTPIAAAITTLFTDLQNDCILNISFEIGPCADPNFDIKEVGLTNKGEPFMTVYGKAGGTLSTVAGQVVYYTFDVDGGLFGGGDTYFITSHFGVEDSTETSNDQKFHGHKLTNAVIDPTNCPNGNKVELFLNDDGRAKVSSNKVVLAEVTPTTVTAAGSGILELEIRGSHVCYVSDIDFGDVVPNL
jgi:hypothetical protein